MPSHSRREDALVASAARHVHESEVALAEARGSSQGSFEAPDAERARLHLMERRHEEALAGQAAGRRRRERFARLREAIGIHAREPTAEAAAPVPTSAPATHDVHSATGAFLDNRGAHREDEDLHPHRLDPAGTDLSDALDRQELARRAAHRDARDAI